MNDFECPGGLQPIQQDMIASHQYKIVCEIKEHEQVPSDFLLVQVLLEQESLSVEKL